MLHLILFILTLISSMKMMARLHCQLLGGVLVAAAIGFYIAYSINTATFLLSALFVFFVSNKKVRELD
ncbi:hypothetical protein KFZ58_00225 [Virgibacillus sp. NKC19-16]|uniref:hypothetical protein n=1 Tax=Virgibacillus salidurans TaxID=2831673 RepID=UPI001F438E44|nr:hypothetical protein [Virgibacillus sp. NKC19-16]UJL46449.1 hypothetical protein KFZ58_00225 [Virgibacillus sp. NKC19-16]